MKKIISLSSVVLIASAILISSCGKDDTNNPSQKGSFAGNWALNENSTDFGASTYNVTISDTASNIQFAYLYGLNPHKTFALVSGNNFTIPIQTIQGSNVSGEGVLTTTTRIDMTYYVQSTATHYDTITAVLNKI